MSDRRETGWSPIYCTRWFLRRFASSRPFRALLLHEEICDEKVANNGEVSINVFVSDEM